MASSSRRVVVSLFFIPSASAAPALAQSLQSEFSAHLPLSDLQWKSSSRSTVRTIDSLQLDFRTFQSTLEQAPIQQIPISLLEKPYLHILFVACDDNEVYRSTVRQQIRDWTHAVLAKRHYQWLIVHVTASKNTGPKKFYQTKGSVYDKIRADFNTGKRDRIVQLPLPASATPPTPPAAASSANTTEEDLGLWRSFLQRVKEFIVHSFDVNFASYEEEVRKVDAQRQMPGWNFCTFFIQKEGLAHSFEAMNLLEDALIQYDELEASYALSARDQSLSWFSRLGGTEPGDDALSILSSTSKPFRNLIIQNNISIFDFRIYLFTRQASLVSQMGRITDLAKRAKPFIYNVSKLLRAHGGALQRNFLEIWVYSASKDVFSRCISLCAASNLNPAAIPELLPTLAELLELACRQVEKLGMQHHYLPRTHPFLMSADVVANDEDETPHSPILSTRQDLKEAMETEEAFDVLYKGLLEEVSKAWKASMRNRCAMKIRATLAALEQARNRTSTSEELYTKLHSAYSQHRWTSIESQLLLQCMNLQRKLQKPRERLLSTLALLRAGLVVGSLKWTLGNDVHGQDDEKIARDMMAEAKELSKDLEKDFAVFAFPLFVMTLASKQGRFVEQEDGVMVDIAIESYLPSNIAVDEIRLKLMNPAGDPLWLTSLPVIISPGKNIIPTNSIASVTGIYVLDLSQIRLAHIVFQYTHRVAVLRSMSINREMLIASKQPFLTFAYDPLAVEVELEEPLENSLVKLDVPRDIFLCIHTSRNQIAKATLRLQEPSGKIRFLLNSARPINDACMVSHVEDALELSNIASNIIKVCIPFEIYTLEPSVGISVTLEYRTTNRPEHRRVLKTTLQASIALPLAVNVQDFLRDDYILSRFTVSSDALLPLRIRNATIENTDNFHAVPCQGNRRKTLTIQRQQPASFVFRISRRKHSADSQNISRLRVNLSYRTYLSEAECILSEHVSRMFSHHGLSLSRKLRRAINSGILASSDVKERNLGELENLILGNFDSEIWRDRLARFYNTQEVWDTLETCLKEAYATPIPTEPLEKLAWHTLSIPFEVPSVAIYNKVSLALPTPLPLPLRVGDFISVTLRICTHFTWASPAERTALDKLLEGQRMLYDISTKTDDWLISGRKKGEFFATQGSEFSIKLALSPIRVGKLFIPSVVVFPLPQPGQPIQGGDILPSCETNHENAATSVMVIQQDNAKAKLWIDRIATEVVVL